MGVLPRRLRPLVKLLVQCGVTLPVFADLLRASVDAAAHDLTPQDKPTDSRISRMTACTASKSAACARSAAARGPRDVDRHVTDRLAAAAGPQRGSHRVAFGVWLFSDRPEPECHAPPTA